MSFHLIDGTVIWVVNTHTHSFSQKKTQYMITSEYMSDTQVHFFTHMYTNGMTCTNTKEQHNHRLKSVNTHSYIFRNTYQ